MSRQAWLDSLQPGDEVAVTYHRRTPEIKQIARRTPSGRLTIEYGTYKREFNPDGSERGSGDYYVRRHLAQVTQAIRDEVEKRAICDRLFAYKWANEPLDTLRKIAAILDKRD